MIPIRPSRLCRDSASVLLFCFLACAAPPPRDVPDSDGKRPNLIVILADDIGIEALGCYGGESYETPHVDQLAREGVLFENAFTQPLCTPTRLELLTGRSNARNYLAFSVLDPKERTFANELRDVGYRTLVVGKWQLYGAEHYGKGIRSTGSLPDQAGFDHHALWQVEVLGRRHWAPTMTIDGQTKVFEQDRYGPDIALESAKAWIAENGQDPFLLFWPMILPHGPFIAPPGPDGPRGTPGDVEMFGPMVEYLDSQVGDLVAFLRERHLERDTVLIFIGDNGSPRSVHSRRHGREVRGGKSKPTDTGSHVPFVIWAPGRLEGGRRLEDLVSTVDVFATLLELADVELPTDRELDGWSLWPRLEGDPKKHRDWVAFHHHPWPVNRPESEAKRWARDERWQLFGNGRLFEVGSDPLLEREVEREGASDAAVAARRKLEGALEALPRPRRGS
ncbi:MAG: sulfatase-like hydrolase/transferase [Planctomycetota bacterium]|nr:sulfatase-like hydrolase/transferase [Planctomycetota bacterium]